MSMSQQNIRTTYMYIYNCQIHVAIAMCDNMDSCVSSYTSLSMNGYDELLGRDFGV